MLGVGLFEFVILFVTSFGGVGVPLGMPPGEMDPLMEKVAPEDCLVYLEWAGMVKADPKSENHYEQLLAEAEIQRFIGQIETLITHGILEESRGDASQLTIATEAPKIAKAVFSNPGCAFVGDVSPSPLTGGVSVDGGLVCNLGDQLEATKASVEKIELALGGLVKTVTVGDAVWKKVPLEEGAPTPMWTFRGKYLVVATSDEEAKNVLDRVRKTPPAWLTELRKGIEVERPGSVFYLNTERAIALAKIGGGGPDIDSFITALGGGNLDSISAVTGLEGENCVTRALLKIDGEPEGLLAATLGEPLTAADLKPIPHDATFAVASKFDSLEVLTKFIAAATEFPLGGDVEELITGLEAEVGIDPKKELFEPLGDTWRLYNSPKDGGLIFTGTTLVVSVDDAETLRKTLDKIQAYVKSKVPTPEDPNASRVPRHVTVADFDFEGEKIYYMKSVGEWTPFAMAWTATEDELVLSFFPAQVKAYLKRADDAKTMTADPIVAEAFKGDVAPTTVVYQNPRDIFRLAYPILQYVLHFAGTEASREGYDLDASMMPSATVIEPHLQPGLTTLKLTERGVELEAKQSLPTGGPVLLFPALLFMGMRF